MAMAAMVAMVAIEAETGPDQWHEGGHSDWQDNEVWQNLAKHISHRFT